METVNLELWVPILIWASCLFALVAKETPRARRRRLGSDELTERGLSPREDQAHRESDELGLLRRPGSSGPRGRRLI